MTPDPWTDVAVPPAGQGGLLTATQLRRRGVGSQTVRTWVARKLLVRLRRNVLVEGKTWRSAPTWDRHLVRARGAMLDRGHTGAVLSHHSALAVLEELRGWTALGRGGPAAGVVIDRADGRHESAGESRTSWLLHRLGLDPTPQERITDARGNLVARVDFLFERGRVVVEFDGMLKYAGRADLTAEKVREDRLRAMGYQVVRLTRADLDRPAAVRSRLAAAFELARRRAR